MNDWANFDEAFSPDKINAVNISTSSNDSRDENAPIDKENILADLDNNNNNNNIVDTLNNLSLDENKNTNDTNKEESK